MSKYGAAMRWRSSSTSWPLLRARRRHDPALEAKFEARWICAGVGLTSDVLVRERGRAEELIPVQGRDERLQFIGIHSRGVGTSDQSPHAGPGSDIDRDPMFLQPADDANMGDAARAAATERDPHRRAVQFSQDPRCAIGPGRRRDGLCDFLNWRGASRATQCQQPREEPRQPLACRVRSRQLPHSTTPCQRYHSRRFQLAPLPFDCEDDGASSRCQGRWWFCRRAGRACTAAIARIGPRVSALKQLAIGWLWEMPTVFAKQGSDHDTSDPAGS